MSEQEPGTDELLGDELLDAERKRIDLEQADKVEEDRRADAAEPEDDE